MWKLVPYPSFAKNCVGQFIDNNDDDDSPIAPPLMANIPFTTRNTQQRCQSWMLSDHAGCRPLGYNPDS